jgi:hypothetical protein
MTTDARNDSLPVPAMTEQRRNKLKVMAIVWTVLAVAWTLVTIVVIFAWLSFVAEYEASSVSAGKLVASSTFELVANMAALGSPSALFAIFAIVCSRKRRGRPLSPAAERTRQASSQVGRAISAVFTRDRLERVLSLTAFALSLGALYNLLGIETAFDTQKESLEGFALGILMPIDPVIVAWAVPGIVIGHICRKKVFEWDGWALAGKIISIVCLILSFTKVGAVLPIFVQSIVLAFGAASGS